MGRIRAGLAVVAAILAAGLPAPPEARAFYCGTKLVSPGDTRIEVRRRCGDPAQEETWRVDQLAAPIGPPPSVVQTVAVHQDAEWLYNPGPTGLMQAVRFRDGLVLSVTSVGLGFRAGSRDLARCRMGTFDRGEVRAKIEALCGPPTDTLSWYDRRTRTSPFGDPERVHVRVQEWTYDFGRAHFVRTFMFENGRLVRVETGDYGR